MKNHCKLKVRGRHLALLPWLPNPSTYDFTFFAFNNKSIILSFPYFKFKKYFFPKIIIKKALLRQFKAIVRHF